MRRSPSRPRRSLATALALLLGVVFAALGCRGSSIARDLGTRLVVIGIDSADWKVIEELAAQGKMKNLMALRRRGVWGPNETLENIPLSPVIWTTMATGKTADQHGIAWFMVDRPDGTRVPVRSYNRKVEALWNILGENGRKATVVGWWATYPAEDVGDGVIVSDALGFHGFGATARGGDDAKKTYPASLYARLAPLVPREEQISADFVRRFLHISPEEYRRRMYDPARSTKRDPSDPIQLFQEYAATAQGYTAIAEKLLSERRDDLFMVYFEQVDSFSHLFMRYAPPKLSWIDPADFERYRDVVARWYEYQDQLLGRLLAKIDLGTTAVVVVSDHGFKSGDRRIRSVETVDTARAALQHEKHGIFVAAGPHIRRGVEIRDASVLDVAPTILYYLGFPVAKDMAGKALIEVFDSEFVAAHPVRSIPTYESKNEPKEKEAAQEGYSKEAAAENEASLRALGYLGGGSPKRPAPVGTTGGAGSAAGAAAGSPAGSREESSPEIHNNLGRIHLAKGDLEEAKKEFEKALELDPDNADALLDLAMADNAQGRTAEAERLAKRALKADPSSVPALSALAALKRDQGDLDEAIRLFREALAIDDSQPATYNGYGDVLQRAHRYQEAEEAFHHALQLDPDSFKAYYNLGVTYSNQGRLDDAVASYRKALELGPHDPEAAKALNNLGAIALGRGRVDQAAGYFERAVEASPVHLESRFNLALIDLDRNRVDDAIALLEEAARLDPDHEQVATTLGMAYLRKGRNEDAYRSFLLVERLYPKNWEARVGLAALYASVHRDRQARQELAEALRLGGKAARAQAGGFRVLEPLLE